MSDEYPKWVTLAEDVGRVLVVDAADEQRTLAAWAQSRRDAGGEQAAIAEAAQALADAEAASLLAEAEALEASSAADAAAQALASARTRRPR